MWLCKWQAPGPSARFGRSGPAPVVRWTNSGPDHRLSSSLEWMSSDLAFTRQIKMKRVPTVETPFLSSEDTRPPSIWQRYISLESEIRVGLRGRG